MSPGMLFRNAIVLPIRVKTTTGTKIRPYARWCANQLTMPRKQNKKLMQLTAINSLYCLSRVMAVTPAPAFREPIAESFPSTFVVASLVATSVGNESRHRGTHECRQQQHDVRVSHQPPRALRAFSPFRKSGLSL